MRHATYLAAAATLLLVSATPATAQEGFPLTFTDALGVEHTFESPPKIGCYHWACHETMGDLGVVPHAAAWATNVADGRPFWIAFKNGLPEVILRDGLSAEEWGASGAEAIIAIAFVVDEVAGLAANAPAPIVYLEASGYGSSTRGPDAYVNNIELLASLIGQPEAGEEAIARWRNVEANLAYLADDDTRDVSVLGILNWDAAFVAMGNDNAFCVTIAAAGVGTCMDVPGAQEVTVSDEEVLAQDPDWIIIQDGANIAGQGAGENYTILDRSANPFWGQLSAVQNDQVYYGGERYFCCSTRGLTHALNEYVHYVVDRRVPHPGHFADFNYEHNALVLDPEVFKVKFPK